MLYRSSALEKTKWTLEIDLQRDYNEYCLRLLERTGVDKSTIDADRAAYEFFNLQKRLIVPKPRKVLFSKEFTYPQEYKKALDLFVDKSEHGESLQPYTSTTILEANYNDMLLEDWNIYHFHLNARFNEKSGFVKRSSYIMYGWVSDDTVYMINTYDHSDEMAPFRKELVQIIFDNWPKLLEPYRLKGIIGLTEKLSDADYKMLRESGVTTFVELGPGKVFGLMGGGYSTDKSSGEAVRSSNFWHNRMHLIEKAIIDNIGGLVSYFEELKNTVGYDFVLKLLWITGTVKKDDEYTFMEMNSGMILQYNVVGRYFRICEPIKVFGEARRRT